MGATMAADFHMPAAAREDLVFDSFEELLHAASKREPLNSGDQKGGSMLERLTVGGRRYVAKRLSLEDDWIMRTASDLAGRPLVMWRSGLLRRLPASIDPAIVACYPGERLGQAVLVMEDVGPYLVPEGDEPIPLEQHLRFMDHMAEVHAAFWGWQDTFGLTPLTTRMLFFHRDQLASELSRPKPAEVPRIALEGWARLERRAPHSAQAIFDLHADPVPLVGALESTPQTFIHGDWKMGNLGSRPDGRTILLDWAVPGQAPGALELAWYLALNRRRIRQSKEEAIDAYWRSLQRHGIPAGDWWPKQLALALLAGMVWFGWEKAYDEDAELGWWEDRVREGLRWL
jgi:aminoglycoside phosphotransferase (APT) family kinase protein